MTRRVRVTVDGADGLAFSEWLQPRLDDRFVILPPRLDAGSESLAGVDVAVCTRLTDAQLAGADSLRLVQLLGADTDGIPFAAVPPSCAACNVYGHESSVAEWVLGAILALTRGALRYDRRLRKGGWGGLNTEVTSVASDIRKQTVGVVGAGPLGRHVIELTRPFFGRQVGITRNPSAARQSELGLDFVGTLKDVERLAQESDILVLCTALSEATRDLIGEPKLRELGPTSYLVNVSHGPVVASMICSSRCATARSRALRSTSGIATRQPRIPACSRRHSRSSRWATSSCPRIVQGGQRQRSSIDESSSGSSSSASPTTSRSRTRSGRPEGETNPTDGRRGDRTSERRRSHGDR